MWQSCYPQFTYEETRLSNLGQAGQVGCLVPKPFNSFFLIDTNIISFIRETRRMWTFWGGVDNTLFGERSLRDSFIKERYARWSENTRWSVSMEGVEYLVTNEDLPTCHQVIRLLLVAYCILFHAAFFSGKNIQLFEAL